ARGHRALFVGGTGLYVQAVVDALTLPGEYPEVRRELEAATADADGLAAAYAELGALDPIAASRTEPGNRRRIVRALEVVRGTGRPFSSFGPGLAVYGAPAIDVALLGLSIDRDGLALRIERRFATMRAAGLLDEVRALAARP